EELRDRVAAHRPTRGHLVPADLLDENAGRRDERDLGVGEPAAEAARREDAREAAAQDDDALHEALSMCASLSGFAIQRMATMRSPSVSIVSTLSTPPEVLRTSAGWPLMSAISGARSAGRCRWSPTKKRATASAPWIGRRAAVGTLPPASVQCVT